jgi:3-deoxy-manno-octulosonate cytidylyltransferase (CMP-KDO synthetase)
MDALIFTGIIPARYASTRFPGKPLADINGKSMIERVYTQAALAVSLREVIVATDDARIYNHVMDFGGRAIMTSPQHTTGTSRCAEALENLEADGKKTDVVINIQGDEPFIDPAQIDDLTGCFQNPGTGIATLIKPVDDTEELLNPNIIKVVVQKSGNAIYFSRAAIPFFRGEATDRWAAKHRYFKHIGIYAYRSSVLQRIIRLEPGTLETAESLEQLRWMENGYSIYCKITDRESHSIDTPEDLKRITPG